jgi:hypothetical protein
MNEKKKLKRMKSKKLKEIVQLYILKNKQDRWKPIPISINISEFEEINLDYSNEYKSQHYFC